MLVEGVGLLTQSFLQRAESGVIFHLHLHLKRALLSDFFSSFLASEGFGFVQLRIGHIFRSPERRARASGGRWSPSARCPVRSSLARQDTAARNSPPGKVCRFSGKGAQRSRCPRGVSPFVPSPKQPGELEGSSRGCRWESGISATAHPRQQGKGSER